MSNFWAECRKKVSLTKEGAAPVQWKTVLLVTAGLFGSAYALTFLFPFLPDMVLYFGYTEEEKGYYAGLIASSMFAGRLFGSYFWGWLSDRKGRKPIMLVCLIFVSITNVAFGFSTNLYTAMIFRFIGGLVNGVVGTCKTILYEISDTSNQAAGMASISLAWGSGIILGPLISGYLANPCRRFPGLCSTDSLFFKFPYLLPSLVAALAALVPVIFIAWALPETLKRKPPTVIVIDKEVDERSELKDKQEIVESGGKPDNSAGVVVKEPAKKKSKLLQVLTTPETRLVILIYGLISVAVIGYDEVFTVFASTDKQLGGLGFGPERIGAAIGLSSVPLIIIQVFLFPILEVRYGSKKVFTYFCYYLIFSSCTLPCLRVLQHHSTIFWVLLLLMMGLQKISVTTLFSANGLHINNSVKPDVAGTVNGVAMTVTSFGRMLAPVLGGSIFSATVSHHLPFPLDVNCVFILFSLFYVTANVMCAVLPERLDQQHLKEANV